MKTFFNTLKKLASAGMVGNSMFSFAFSVAAIFWADHRPEAGKAALTMLAVFSARTAGCLFNNLVDRRYDAKNPRTKNRPLADGSLSVKAAWTAVAALGICTALCALALDIKFLFLLPVPLAICFLYAFTKRFTWLCHFILGIACAAAPVGSWLVFSTKWEPVPILLIGAMVASWTAGYDILYATQDHDFDCEIGLHSVPAKFGEKAAVWIAFAMHFATIGLFFLWGRVMDFGSWYFVGAFLCTAIIISEHLLLRNGHYERAQRAFLLNQAVGSTMLIFTLLECFLGS